jgi:hypothetical protein
MVAAALYNYSSDASEYVSQEDAMSFKDFISEVWDDVRSKMNTGGARRALAASPAVTSNDGRSNGRRSVAAISLITRQVVDVASVFAPDGVLFDEDNADWVIFPYFPLPPRWGVVSAPARVEFPPDYPVVAPIGFYLPEVYRRSDAVLYKDPHFVGEALHGASKAPALEGWAWFCCYTEPGSWRPAPDDGADLWKTGDNLRTFVQMMVEVLATDS